MAWVSSRLRRQVAERARYFCEYCQTQRKMVVTMQIDHIIPKAAGGTTALDNLCLACIGCNSFKRDFQVGLDPTTEEESPLFNPRQQQWDDHFQWSDSKLRLIGLTATGRATISRLRINRAELVDSRREWVDAGKHPPVHDL